MYFIVLCNNVKKNVSKRNVLVSQQYILIATRALLYIFCGRIVYLSSTIHSISDFSKFTNINIKGLLQKKFCKYFPSYLYKREVHLQITNRLNWCLFGDWFSQYVICYIIVSHDINCVSIFFLFLLFIIISAPIFRRSSRMQ